MLRVYNYVNTDEHRHSLKEAVLLDDCGLVQIEY